MAVTSTDGNGQVTDEVKSEETVAAVQAVETAAAEVPDSSAAAGGAPAKEGAESKKWPGWPGDNVFRLIVPVAKVGSIIGKKGELIKKICEETRAKIRVLDGVAGTADRVVLIHGKEDPEAESSPAMNAVLKVFKRVSGVSGTGADGAAQESSTPATCSVRLLVPASQAINLIGKQGSSIKSFQENSGAIIRVITGGGILIEQVGALSMERLEKTVCITAAGITTEFFTTYWYRHNDELPFYVTEEERVVDIQGEPLKVLKALEAVVGHLRKFLVDHSILPLFEKSPQPNAPLVQAQAPVAAPWSDQATSLIHTAQQSGMGSDYSFPLKRDSLYLEHDSHLDSQIQRSGALSSLYRQEPPLSGLHSTGLGRSAAALVTQVTQTMQIPIAYAEDIIGIGGANIAYIRRTSGAVLTVQESGGLHDEITVEIKGSSTQVQAAQQLIQDFMSGHKEPAVSGYGGLDTGLRSSSYSHLASSAYSSSSLTSEYGGYGSGLGRYGDYRY